MDCMVIDARPLKGQFGGLHIEMVVLKMLGDLLEGSGWTGALVQAGITTSGLADAFLKAKHVTRSRWAHQAEAAPAVLKWSGQEVGGAMSSGGCG